LKKLPQKLAYLQAADQKIAKTGEKTGDFGQAQFSFQKRGLV
jgi:hypothetical protein